MLGLVLILALVALGLYAAYSAKTSEGFDWKKGLAAVAALGAAAWAYLSDLAGRF